MLRTAVACAAALSLAACTPTLTRQLAPADDPSNPDAPASPIGPPSRTLERTQPAAPDETPPAPAAPERHHAPAPAAAPDATIYTCPMHPEVSSDHPGRCPKCGMALVPKKEGPKP